MIEFLDEFVSAFWRFEKVDMNVLYNAPVMNRYQELHLMQVVLIQEIVAEYEVEEYTTTTLTAAVHIYLVNRQFHTGLPLALTIIKETFSNNRRT